jgi:hypothetical protein
MITLDEVKELKDCIVTYSYSYYYRKYKGIITGKVLEDEQFPRIGMSNLAGGRKRWLDPKTLIIIEKEESLCK